MHCPQLMQPNTEALCEATAFPLIISMIPSEHTSAQSPHPLHFSRSIEIRPDSYVREVGMGIE
jgi:hypothetical protein